MRRVFAHAAPPLLALCGVAAALGAGAATAAADVFGPVSLMSSTAFEQFEYTHDPAISGDGRYIVFDGSIGGVKGIWRRESGPGGEVEEVAGGDAELPSISRNGQYVSFTTNEGGSLSKITNEKLVPSTNAKEPVNVYVRDMDDAPQGREHTSEETGGPDGKAAFTLMSAKNGSTEELGYENEAGEEESAQEREEGAYGAMAAGRSAIDAEGNRVAFVTTSMSDLAGPKTPALEVAVRDLETDETQLVSVEYDPTTGMPAINGKSGQPEPVPGGAVFTSSGAPPAFAGRVRLYELQSGAEATAGASISGNGTTVAWMGERLAEQIRLLPGEQVEAPNSLEAIEGAPLWRRIANGPDEPTRAVTGGPEPESPGCVAHPENTLPSTHTLSDSCQGPFESARIFDEKEVDPVPQLSYDGYTVAFLANGSLVAEGAGESLSGRNVYVSNIHSGLTYREALRPLTEVTSQSSAIAVDARIVDLGISPDGEQVAFSTMRTVFPLGSITYVSTPAAVPGMAELFDVDLANSTITRVTHGYEGAAAQRPHSEKVIREDPYFESESDGSLSPSFSENGDTLVFSSTATNLVYGDGNAPVEERKPGFSREGESESDGSDVFLINRTLFGSTPAPQDISSPPAPPSLEPVWDLGATALSLSDGNVLLYLNLPGGGTLSANASSAVKVRSARAARSARRGHAKTDAKNLQPASTVLPRTVASATQELTSTGGGLTTVLLKLGSAYRAFAAQKGGLSATVNLTFTAPGHPVLHQSIAVSFLAPGKSVAKHRRAGAHAHSKTRRGSR
jgi:hypothetical protein